MATEEEVVNVLRYMAAAWPRTEISEHTVAVYVMHMLRTRLAADILLLAAMHLVDTREFFPSVAEWRTEAMQIESMREVWYCTSNYQVYGHALPEELSLPKELAANVLGGAPAQIESGGLR
jgi:hypothetical protein